MEIVFTVFPGTYAKSAARSSKGNRGAPHY